MESQQLLFVDSQKSADIYLCIEFCLNTSQRFQGVQPGGGEKLVDVNKSLRNMTTFFEASNKSANSSIRPSFSEKIRKNGKFVNWNFLQFVNSFKEECFKITPFSALTHQKRSSSL